MGIPTITGAALDATLECTFCVIGLDIDKNGVQRIESGQRFVTDIEIGYLAKLLGTTINYLLDVQD